jgi:hypothetical protein
MGGMHGFGAIPIDEDYQRAQQHRAASLEGQLLIECGAAGLFS